MSIERNLYFLALCRTGNVSKAAAQLHISRQGLSKSIAALEQEIGVALFRRTRRGVVPTEAGELLRECLEAQEELWDALLVQVKSLVSPTAAQTIRIGVYDIYYTYRDKLDLYAYRRSRPGIAIETRNVDFDEGWDLVRAGELDFALSITPPPAFELIAIPFASNDVSVLMRADNPLAARDKVDFDTDLCGVTVLQPSAYLRRLYIPYYNTRGSTLRHVHVDRNSLRALVATSDNLFIAASAVAQKMLADGLTVRPLVNSPLGEHDLDSCLVCRPGIEGAARTMLLDICRRFQGGKGCSCPLEHACRAERRAGTEAADA